MGSTPEVLTVVPIHRRPDLIEACADLINEEWKRSQASRIHSLQKSCEDFPVCLVLIKNQRESQSAGDEVKVQCQLVGHARLAQVLGQTKSLFVESVVISKQFRGKGHGRKLMEATESYARSRGFRQLYLTTHDKQHFYAHLGYTLSEPVQSVGAMTSFVSMQFLEVLSRQAPTSSYESDSKAISSPLSSMVIGSPVSSNLLPTTAGPLNTVGCPPLPSVASTASHVSIMVPPPPPPPPPPLPQPMYLSSHVSSITPCPPPAPPLPPSAHVCSTSSFPPLLPTASSVDTHMPGTDPQNPSSDQVDTRQLDSTNQEREPHIEQTLLETPYRDFRGLPIFWMKKHV